MKTSYKKISELPEETIPLLKEGKVTYRGCGMGKYYGFYKIKVKGKEYMVTDDLFYELTNIKPMKFSAPTKKY